MFNFYCFDIKGSTMTAHDFDPAKETIFLEDIPPPVERALAEKARAEGTDPSTAASEIIERHIAEESAELD
jgi:hypothetical protein